MACTMLMGRTRSEIAPVGPRSPLGYTRLVSSGPQQTTFLPPNCCLKLPFAVLSSNGSLGEILMKIDDLPRCEHILKALCILLGLVKLVDPCRPHLFAVGNPHFAALVCDLRHGVSGA